MGQRRAAAWKAFTSKRLSSVAAWIPDPIVERATRIVRSLVPGLAPNRVSVAKLAGMGAEEFRATTARLRQASGEMRAKGSPALEDRIRAFELRYEMSSDQLRARVASGEQRETAEVAQWLFLLAARGEPARGPAARRSGVLVPR